MKYVSPNELDKCLDKIQYRYDLPDRIINTEFKLLLPVVIVGSIINIVASRANFLKFFLFELALLAGYLVIAFTVPFLTSIISGKRLIKRISGGKLQSMTSKAFYEKYGGFVKIHKNDLCSDQITSQAEKLTENETDPALRAVLESCLMVMYGYRLEAEKMQAAHDKCLQDYDPERNTRYDDLVTEINCAILSSNGRRVLELYSANEDFIDHRLGTAPGFVVDYAIAASICKREEGDLVSALEYIEAAQKLHEKARNILPMGVAPTRTESENYRRASISLEKAKLLLANGTAKAAMEELDQCDLIIADLKCDVPPLFIKEHQELMAEISPFMEKNEEC
ncbi:MAG: hypothetical protein KBI35_06635 [Ruminococcus sp.]|nr:hypothetical protein [Ruminococcus sp.]